MCLEGIGGHGWMSNQSVRTQTCRGTLRRWLRLATTIASLSVLVVSAAAMAESADDPIVGHWVLDKEYGDYQFEITCRANGSATKILFGEKMAGKWKKDGQRYLITPSGEDDYYLLKRRSRGWVLESWDAEGLIRVFNRAQK